MRSKGKYSGKSEERGIDMYLMFYLNWSGRCKYSGKVGIEINNYVFICIYEVSNIVKEVGVNIVGKIDGENLLYV